MNSFECLESRRLMDASPAPIVINGTPGSDLITIQPYQPTTGNASMALIGKGTSVTKSLVVNVNGTTSYVTPAPGQVLKINGLDGNDVIRMYNTNTPAEVHAGNGDDVVGTAGGNDLIFGDDGRDRIDAGAGNDTVHGGAAPDTTNGGLGDDVLYADGGGDNVYGAAGADRIYGGNGPDWLHGDDGGDTIVTIGGGTSDTAWGDAGFDSFWVDKAPTEKIGDANLSEMAINLHYVGSYDVLNVNGVPQSNGPVLTMAKAKKSPAPFMGPLASPGAFNLGSLGGLGSIFNPTNLPDPDPNGYQYKNFSNLPLFGRGGPMPDDIRQGWLGDCYFMAGLGALAKYAPNTIKQNIVDMGDGTYVVRMFDKQHVEHYLHMDADLPVSGSSPAYAGLGVGDTLWVALMEKAWAFFRKNLGTYKSIEGGWPEHTYQSMGLRTTVLASTTYNSPGLMVQAINNLLANQNSVTFVTKNKAPVLVGLHVYMVDRVINNPDGSTSVRVRNPWGTDGHGVGDATDGNNDGYLTLRAEDLFQAYDQVAGGRM
jgi:hypothetical protein